MTVSEKGLKWAMRFYPPLLLQRVWVRRIGGGFREAEVKIFRSIVNINYNKSVFGGTIFSAADPFYAVCLYQILKRKNMNVKLWVKSASVDYIKPAYTSLYFRIQIPEEDIAEICSRLASGEKIVKCFLTEIRDSGNVVCARVESEIYIRRISS